MISANQTSRKLIARAWFLPLLIGIVGLTTFGGCQPESTSKSKPVAVVTVGMLSDIVKNIAGDRIEVQTLMGPGVDPHLYTPTTNDARKLQAADIVFFNGLMLEGKMGEALSGLKDQKPVIEAGVCLEGEKLLDGDEGHKDPHVWMDPRLWSKVVDLVTEELVKFDPDGKDSFQDSAQKYKKRLADLYQFGKTITGTIPKQKRILITSHDAFQYFGKAFEIQVEGLQGISTESEAGLARVHDLIDLIVKNKVEAVFVESSVSQKNIQSLVEGAASKGQKIKIGGTLFSDAMGKAGTYEGTYVGMIDHNLQTVTKALGGKIEKPFDPNAKFSNQNNH